jgi:glutamate dehydrogenase
MSDKSTRSQLLNSVPELAKTWGATTDAVKIFVETMAQEDIDHRSLADAKHILHTLWDYFQKRAPEDMHVTISNPTTEHPDQAHILIHMRQIPFISDSVYAALRQEQIDIGFIINASIKARRDDEGHVLAVHPDEDYGPDLEDEKLIYLDISKTEGSINSEELKEKLMHVLFDVAAAVHDWQGMEAQLADTIDDLHGLNPSYANPDDVLEAAQFLNFLKQGHFTFLGYREHIIRNDKDMLYFDMEKDRSLGMLRDDNMLLFDGLMVDEMLPNEVKSFLQQPNPLMVVLKATRRSHVHRAVHLDVIIVKKFNAQGKIDSIRLFAGLFTAQCYAFPAEQIPYINRKVRHVLTRSGFEVDSHRWRNLKHILDLYPRDELFQIDADTLYHDALGIQRLYNHPGFGIFIRKDVLQRFFSCLIYLPKEAYGSRLRHRIQTVLEEELNGKLIEHYVLVNEHPLARLQCLIDSEAMPLPEFDLERIKQRLMDVSTDWFSHLKQGAVQKWGKQQALSMLQDLQHGFSISYQDEVSIPEALDDLPWIRRTMETKKPGAWLYRNPHDPVDTYHFKIYVPEEALLSQILPVLDNLGFKTDKEYSHDITLQDGQSTVWIHELIGTISGLPVDKLDAIKDVFAEAFLAGWAQKCDTDRFSSLVTYVGLHWREALIFRALARFLDLAQYPIGKSYMAQCLASHPAITRLLCDLYLQRNRIDQTRDDAQATSDIISNQILTALNDVEKLDDDKVLRSILNLILNVMRTNYYHVDDQGQSLDYLSFKFDSQKIDDLPQPRLKKEIFVYSRRMESIHFRGGDIARGGIRWSDRFEDFRTEVLGLVKAQMVKNTVIVPLGAKGGFIPKLIHRFNTPEDRRNEAIEAYKIMVRAMLSLTDNIIDGENIPPAQTFCWDNPDPYLVVAADKGTASFSDIANKLSLEHNFWLGDAFASGGSKGYDHKGMGITARGAWECVKRHFRELGKDIQTTGFTVAGVGDMSGDVFGNGMLLSPCIQLVAAFDHRHIFIDPSPDMAKSFAERERLFNLPGSSWADYNPKLISTGGGVYSRQEKSITLSEEAQQILGLTQAKITPNDLMQAVLRAPVELLYFGGIGTYIKGSNQSHQDVGDKGNDAIRVNGHELRCQVVGEGANLGVTQSGRIEYARQGGKINTDFVDNSAGVDTSDHEVNIKILLQALLNQNLIDEEKRVALLEEMTDEVAAHVLQDNYDQSLAISLMEHTVHEDMPQYAQFIRDYEKIGLIQRKLENLPDDEGMHALVQRKQSLTRPDLAVLLSYAKMHVYSDMLESDIPDKEVFHYQVLEYFPEVLRAHYHDAIMNHQLRREIIATAMTNVLLNRMGPAFVHGESQRLNVKPALLAQSWLLVRSIFDLRTLWQNIDQLDNMIPATEQNALYQTIAEAMGDATKWFIRHHGETMDVDHLIPLYRDKAQKLHHWLKQQQSLIGPNLSLSAPLRDDIQSRIDFLPYLTASCDITSLSSEKNYKMDDVAEIYFSIENRLQLGALSRAISSLPADSMWTQEVQENLHKDLHDAWLRLCEAALKHSITDIQEWLERYSTSLHSLDQVLKDLPAQSVHVSMLTVAIQRLRQLADSASIPAL